MYVFSGTWMLSKATDVHMSKVYDRPAQDVLGLALGRIPPFRVRGKTCSHIGVGEGMKSVAYCG